MNRSPNRLRTPADFATARARAERGWPHRLLVLYVAPNDLDSVRVGITVSGRVGNAVTRNRVRRRLRELLSARLRGLKNGQDLLVVARPSSAEASWEELGLAVDTLLLRAHATSHHSVHV